MMMSRSSAFVLFIVYAIIGLAVINYGFGWMDIGFLTSIQQWVLAIAGVIIIWSGLKFLMTSTGMGGGYGY